MDCTRDVELRAVPYAGIDVFTVAPYASVTAALLRRAKYGGGDRRLCGVLAELLAMRSTTFVGAFRAVVPVPTPWTRRLSRGFSPPSVLAGPVGRVVRAPVVHALSLDPGTPQAALDGRARRTNLDGRVHVRRRVQGRVLLVDDAVTSGSTARACAAALRSAGADEVAVLCLVSTDAVRS